MKKKNSLLILPPHFTNEETEAQREKDIAKVTW